MSRFSAALVVLSLSGMLLGCSASQARGQSPTRTPESGDHTGVEQQYGFVPLIDPRIAEVTTGRYIDYTANDGDNINFQVTQHQIAIILADQMANAKELVDPQAVIGVVIFNGNPNRHVTAHETDRVSVRIYNVSLSVTPEAVVMSNEFQGLLRQYFMELTKPGHCGGAGCKSFYVLLQFPEGTSEQKLSLADISITAR